MMKPSRYNFVFPYQFNRDYSVAYNSFRNTAAILTAREAEFILTCDRSLGIHHTKTDDFQNKGFIIDSNIDELSVLKVEYLKTKFDTKLLSVVIIPTYCCNMDCAYCYEKLSYSTIDNTIMNEEIQDRIYRWIERNLHGVETLEVFWHGGEPLMALGVVKRLGGMLKKLAEDKNIAYLSKMSTGVHLLTGEIAQVLKEIGITEYKITMNSNAAYDTMLGNIEENIDCIDKIDLRINVNKEDLMSAYDLMRILDEKGLSSKVTPRLGKPREFAVQMNDKVFTKEEYSCEAVNYSLRQGVGPKEYSGKDCFCLAGQLNGVIIDGHGTVFKCVSDTGDGQSCGKLKDDATLEFNKNFYAHGISNPLENEQCEKCPFLPLCTGECAYDRRAGNPCTYGSLTEECRARYINAYVVKRLLNRLETNGFSNTGENGIIIDDLIMGRYNDKMIQFINNAQSTYLLEDLTALAVKNGISLNEEDEELLLQLIQPTELAL